MVTLQDIPAKGISRFARDGEKTKPPSRRRPAKTRGYFLAASALAASDFAYLRRKRSTRPAVSTSFCLPVKNGWQLEQISTRSMSPLTVERVWKLFPQAQCTVTGW